MEVSDATQIHLRRTMHMIRRILEREQIAATVILYRDHASEFLLHVNPEWSVAQEHVNEKGEKVIQISTRRASFDSVAVKRAALEKTIGMFRHFADVSMHIHRDCQKLLKLIYNQIEVQHSHGIMTFHNDDDPT